MLSGASLGRLLGASWAPLGASWAHLGALWERSWRCSTVVALGDNGRLRAGPAAAGWARAPGGRDRDDVARQGPQPRALREGSPRGGGAARAAPADRRAGTRTCMYSCSKFYQIIQFSMYLYILVVLFYSV